MRSLLCLAALGAALSIPASAQAKTFTLAVQDDNVMLGLSAVMSPEQGLQAMKTIKAKTVRFNVAWATLLQSDAHATTAPSSPAYDFSRLDTAIDTIRAAGNTVQLTITGPAPAWATGNRKRGTYKVDATKFARFARTAATHFSGRVTAISVWNEPNWPTTLEPVLTCKKVKKKKVCVDQRPKLYRAIYTKAYAAIKSASPKMPVWLGELAPMARTTTKGKSLAPLAFLRTMLCVDATVKRRTCTGLKADALAVHPYNLGVSPKAKPRGKDDLSMGVLSRASGLLGKLERVKALRRPNGSTGIPLALTEFGYLTTGGARGATLSQQATWIPQAVTIARKASRVNQLLLYQLVDSDNPDVTWNSGLYRSNGVPKPVVAKLAAGSA